MFRNSFFFLIFCSALFAQSDEDIVIDRFEPLIAGTHEFPLQNIAAICLKGVVSEIQTFDSTGIRYSSDSSIFFFEKYGYTFYAPQSIQWVSLDTSYVDLCPGMTDHRFLQRFSSSTIFLPDSLNIQIGDTVKIENYYVYTTGAYPEPLCNLYPQGHYTVNGVKYTDPNISAPSLIIPSSINSFSGLIMREQGKLLQLTNHKNDPIHMELFNLQGKKENRILYSGQSIKIPRTWIYRITIQ
jgi:hypothetical protein